MSIFNLRQLIKTDTFNGNSKKKNVKQLFSPQARNSFYFNLWEFYDFSIFVMVLVYFSCDDVHFWLFLLLFLYKFERDVSVHIAYKCTFTARENMIVKSLFCICNWCCSIFSAKNDSENWTKKSSTNLKLQPQNHSIFCVKLNIENWPNYFDWQHHIKQSISDK